MNFHHLVSDSISDTLLSLSLFTPELTLCATIVLMLFVRLFNFGQRLDAFYFALVGAGVALFMAAPWANLDAPRVEIFTGMLVYDGITVYIRMILLVFLVLFLLLTRLTGIPDREEGPDTYSLVLGATLGLCLMASANHLIMVFMAVEMASVPSYVLAGLLKGRRKSSEAALKYAIYGAGTAGVMLYGISLLAGLLNTAHLPTLAIQLADRLPQMGGGELTVLALGGLMLMVGLAFKLSAVPFHFWCPDVFEGATAEVAAFLSIASKAGALALLVRVAIGFGAIVPPGEAPVDLQAAVPAAIVVDTVSVAALESGALSSESTPAEFVATVEAAVPSDDTSDDQTSDDQLANRSIARMQALQPARNFIGKLVAFFAIITCTFGNLAAFGQTNIKRLLAYSTIAHAGYMMMAVPAIMVMAGYDKVGAQNAVAGLGIYIGVYVFMNLGAFAVVAFLRNAMHSEEIADYSGLLRRCPATVICFSIALFSLLGLPPFAGFLGKFAVFASLAQGGFSSIAAGHDGFYLLVVLTIAGLNTVVSLFYYLRVVKVMVLDPEPADRPPMEFSETSFSGMYLWLITAATVLLFVFGDTLSSMAQTAASHLLM